MGFGLAAEGGLNFLSAGGFVGEMAWDGIDGHICRLNGWIGQSVEAPEMRIIHLRPMGSSRENIRVGCVPLARAAIPVWRGLHHVCGGHLRALITGHQRYEHPAYRRSLRRFKRKNKLARERPASRGR